MSTGDSLGVLYRLFDFLLGRLSVAHFIVFVALAIISTVTIIVIIKIARIRRTPYSVLVVVGIMIAVITVAVSRLALKSGGARAETSLLFETLCTGCNHLNAVLAKVDDSRPRHVVSLHYLGWTS